MGPTSYETPCRIVVITGGKEIAHSIFPYVVRVVKLSSTRGLLHRYPWPWITRVACCHSPRNTKFHREMQEGKCKHRSRQTGLRIFMPVSRAEVVESVTLGSVKRVGEATNK